MSFNTSVSTMLPDWREALRLHQPEAWRILRDQNPGQLPNHEPELHLIEKPLAAFLLGLGTGTLLQQALLLWPEDIPIYILSSDLPRAAAQAKAWSQTLLADVRIHWLIGSADVLQAALQEARYTVQDHFDLAWLELEPDSEARDIFLESAAFQPKRPDTSDLAALYRALLPVSAQAAWGACVSCQAGCDACCHRSVGFYLLLDPLEWALLYESLWRLPAVQRQMLWRQTVESLAPHSEELLDLVCFVDAQPEQWSQASFHLELAQMAGVGTRSRACVFLQAGRCSVYEGRPLTCRLYGVSHVDKRRPFTCEKDWEKLQSQLNSETPLVDFNLWRARAEAAHGAYTHKQVLNLWLLTHLDWTRQDFKSDLCLDYHQFARLAREQTLQEEILSDLQAAWACLLP